MLIGKGLKTCGFRSHVLAPDLSVTEVEALVRSKTVLVFLRRRGKHIQQRHMRYANSAIVGGVFAEC